MRWMCLLLALVVTPALHAQRAGDTYSHTRYELLAPHTSSFRIVYRVAPTGEGRTQYFNTIRRGSECTDIAVFDEATGRPLPHEVLEGPAARKAGHETARDDTSYIRISFPEPLAAGAEKRLVIEKTYRDPGTYHRDGAHIVFDRSLGIRRNTIVLPPQYEVISCNVPSQIDIDDTGRIAVSFINTMPGAAALRIEARPLPGSLWRPDPGANAGQADPDAAPPTAGTSPTFPIRNEDSRTIVYYPRQPETHQFDLYHDVTITRAGQDAYLNWVRRGSSVSSPQGFDLDRGRELPARILKGQDIIDAGYGADRRIDDDTELAVIPFEPVAEGQTFRLRVEETYTDPARYRLEQGELVWHRAFGRTRNAVVLPDGWYPVASGVPATVAEDDDGRIWLEYHNDRPGNIDVYIRARPRDVVEARSVTGEPLLALEVTTERQLERADNLANALQLYAENPENESIAISAGRHLAWYGRFRDAIAFYTQRLEERPDSFRLLRHRGHRFITTRQFDRAAEDLGRAAEIIESNWEHIDPATFHDDDTPDQYRWSTWYHLGLAHYLNRDFSDAERAFRRTRELSPDPDKLAAASYWLTNTLRQLGRHEEARELAEPFHREMDIRSNLSYYELMLYFKGETTLEETLDIEDPGAPRFGTLGYGIASRFMFDGRRDDAIRLYRRIIEHSDWLAFGHIGAEVELATMGEAKR